MIDVVGKVDLECLNFVKTDCILRLTVDLSALFKIAISFSLKHHVSLSYNIPDLSSAKKIFSAKYLSTL